MIIYFIFFNNVCSDFCVWRNDRNKFLYRINISFKRWFFSGLNRILNWDLGDKGVYNGINYIYGVFKWLVNEREKYIIYIYFWVSEVRLVKKFKK